MKNLLKGLAIGLAVGYLTAPHSGKKSRQKLSGKAGNLNLKGFWEDAKSQLNDLVGEVKEKAGVSNSGDLTEKAENKLDQFKHEANRTAERTNYQYNQKVEDLSNTAHTGINQAEQNLKM